MDKESSGRIAKAIVCVTDQDILQLIPTCEVAWGGFCKKLAPEN